MVQSSLIAIGLTYVVRGYLFSATAVLIIKETVRCKISFEIVLIKSSFESFLWLFANICSEFS